MENELIRKYELMMIIDSQSNDEDKEKIFKEAVEAVSKSGGKVINNQVWLDKHKLTFEIKKCREGTYYMINFEADGEVNDKIKNILKLNERVLRFKISNFVKSFVEPAKSK